MLALVLLRITPVANRNIHSLVEPTVWLEFSAIRAGCQIGEGNILTNFSMPFLFGVHENPRMTLTRYSRS